MIRVVMIMGGVVLQGKRVLTALRTKGAEDKETEKIQFSIAAVTDNIISSLILIFMPQVPQKINS